MQVLNLSSEPLGRLYSWLPHDLAAESVVFLPDACPGKSPLPTGTVVLTRQPDWRRFAVSDCGCGMRLVRSALRPEELTATAWNVLADALRRKKGGLGDLGGGNHFMDALAPYDGEHLHLLIHTGSRMESGHVDALVDQPEAFDREFTRIVDWAAENRSAVQSLAQDVLGPLELVLDLPHNTYEVLPDGGTLIRKGAVRVEPGEMNIIPSHMSGDIALVKATPKVSKALFSLSHGTGRTMSRSESKTLADAMDFNALRAKILLPQGLQDASLRSEGPQAYRDLDGCLDLLEGYVEEVDRFEVVGYMGHL